MNLAVKEMKEVEMLTLNVHKRKESGNFLLKVRPFIMGHYNVHC